MQIEKLHYALRYLKDCDSVSQLACHDLITAGYLLQSAIFALFLNDVIMLATTFK